MHETELKFVAHGPMVFPDLADGHSGIASVEALEPQELRATYFDTQDLRLARNGITLRYRTGEDTSDAWTLKFPVQDKGDARDELHFDGPPKKIPADANDLVTAFVRSASLGPVAHLRTKRKRWVFKGATDNDLAELDEDEVSVLQNRRVVARFRELELEAREADRVALARIANALRASGAVDSEPIPKAVRALGPRASAPPDVPEPDTHTAPAPAAAVIKAAIATGTRRLMINDPLARLDDPEGVHQMRVAARRLRSDLRTFGDLVDAGWSDSLVIELKWLGDALGGMRDIDVMRTRLVGSAEGLEEPLGPLFISLAEAHDKARTAMLDALRSDRYRDLLERLVVASSLPMVTEAASGPCDEILPPLVETRWKKLADHARGIKGSDPDDRWHEVRIRAKRTRYAAEAIAGCLGKPRSRQAEEFADLVAAVQDALGAYQDASVATETILRSAAEQDGNASFQLAAGRLLERQTRTAADARARFNRTWGKLDRKKTRRWLTA